MNGAAINMQTAREALGHWSPELAAAEIEAFGNGLINSTFRVTTSDGRQFILQAMNAAIAPEINTAIDRLGRHLHARGMQSPRLIPTEPAGTLWVVHQGVNWRLADYIPGVCHDRLDTPDQAYAAGALLGRFHRNVTDLDLQLQSPRLGVHDTPRHVAALRSALDDYRAHPAYDSIAPLAADVFAAIEQLEPIPRLPDRLVHGDPKISNLVFAEGDGQGICTIDLDTLAYMPLPLELGDAFRSWCNPRGEDVRVANFRTDLFGAAARGYADNQPDDLQEAEWRAFLPATLLITLELASRFARDALEDCYFGWDPARFPDRSTHNQVRAVGQLALFHSQQALYAEAETSLVQAFKG